jgi:peptidyl-tRNA hydrolase, PTH1 family
MFLIVCLGNYEKKYNFNRHNAGFRAGDSIISTFNFEKIGKKFKSIVYEGMIGTEKVYLIKPQTYMNLSGEAAQLISAFYKIPHQQICVIYDDFDLPLGTIRIRQKGSAGTHNGLKSMISLLGTTSFPRIRIGIGPKPDFMAVVSFVLSDFTKEEESNLGDIFERTTQAIKTIITDGIHKAMNNYNRTDTNSKDSQESKEMKL